MKRTQHRWKIPLCSLTLAHRCLPLPLSLHEAFLFLLRLSPVCVAGQWQWCKARSNGVTPLSCASASRSAPRRRRVPFLPCFISAASPLCRRPCCLRRRAGCWEGCWETSCLVLWEPRWGSSEGWWAQRRWRACRSRAWWRRSGRGSSGCQAPGWGWALSCPGDSCPGPAGL